MTTKWATFCFFSLNFVINQILDWNEFLSWKLLLPSFKKKSWQVYLVFFVLKNFYFCGRVDLRCSRFIVKNGNFSQVQFPVEKSKQEIFGFEVFFWFFFFFRIKTPRTNFPVFFFKSHVSFVRTSEMVKNEISSKLFKFFFKSRIFFTKKKFLWILSCFFECNRINFFGIMQDDFWSHFFSQDTRFSRLAKKIFFVEQIFLGTTKNDPTTWFPFKCSRPTTFIWLTRRNVVVYCNFFVNQCF